MLAVLPWMKVWAADKPLELPFFVPFPGMGKAGAKLSVDFECPKRRHPWYAILAPRPVDPNKPLRGWTMYLAFLFKDGDLDDFRRVEEFAGSLSGKNGISVRLHVSIVSIGGHETSPIYDEVVLVEQKASGAGNGRIDRIVDGVLLDPGFYRLEVEAVDDIPVLIPESLKFGIAYPHGK
ncbi:DUF5625 family protein [Propionivibrio dicarboxylicus]|uniref:DUF5625 family protein n=1 Tax=Propionivibrio dicarboxylicus TaxID=83767 RepID=UPI001FE1DF28|nr:DUF5625 family protein [Propionivibrio dicarboxylicus]